MPWVIKYNNQSKSALIITPVGGIAEVVWGEANHQTGDSLSPGASDYLSLDQNAVQGLAQGLVDFYQGVGTLEKMLWVRIHVPVQVFGIGTDPYWFFLVNAGENPTLDNPLWQQHDADTVNVNVGAFAVTLSPTTGGSDLTVDITFKDLPSAT